MKLSVTGLGIICAIGNDCQEVMESLRQRKSGVGRMQYLQSAHTELPVGEVKMSDAELKNLLGIPAEDIYSRTTLLGAVAVRQAMADAHLTPDSLRGKRVVLISGTTVGGMDVTERLFDQMRTDDSVLKYINRHDCGSTTHEIAQLCGIECEVCTISTACSSAINSIIVGSEMLRTGEADIVIAGGSEALSKFHLNGFNTLHILDTEQCRPFDKTRVGLNLGEGAAFVVLTSTDNLQEGEKETAPAPAKAYIGGYGNRCDAFHQTASSEDGEGAYLAMTEALANVNKEDIDYINAHGTGTPNNDPSESAALRRIFGDRMPLVSSTKGFTGHTTSASGSIETVISILAMQNDFVPVSYGFKEEDEACIRPFTGDDAPHLLNNVLCNSFGFGGNDSSLLLTKDAIDLPLYNKEVEVEVAADVTIDTVEQLADYKDYISPKEGRRMGRLMKAATMTSLMALKEAGICNMAAPTSPLTGGLGGILTEGLGGLLSIITATANGMLDTSEKFLVDMVDNGEETLSPTLFMQSTHNTIGSAVAIRLGCHGYNITYTQGADSLRWAMRDAERLIRTGKAKMVLVGCHDEATEQFQSFYERLGQPVPPAIYSRSILLRAKNCSQTDNKVNEAGPTSLLTEDLGGLLTGNLGGIK